MATVKTLIYLGEDNYAVRIDDLHTVDVGPVNVHEVDFTTRDGEPGMILWKQDLGFLVAVHSPGSVTEQEE